MLVQADCVGVLKGNHDLQPKRGGKKGRGGRALAEKAPEPGDLSPCLDHGILELDNNNAAERGTRAIAFGRTNNLFVGSGAGGKAAAIAFTPIETARLNGAGPQAWLSDTIACISDHKITKVDELLPWRRSRQRSARTLELEETGPASILLRPRSAGRRSGPVADSGRSLVPSSGNRPGVIASWSVARSAAFDSMDTRLLMPADRPSSPSRELADRREWKGPTLANGVLTEELAEFCQCGLSIVLASCDDVGRPVVGRGIACRIGADGRVRVVFREPPNTAFRQAIAAGAPIAATFTLPSSHRSIQLKAPRAELGPSAPPDGPSAMRQGRGFADDLVRSGYPERFALAYLRFEPYELAALEFLPTGAFVQTPGPSAGSALTP